jgi:hypothetical protein
MGAELSAKFGKIDLSRTNLEGATIDKSSLDEIYVTKQQIETMNIIDTEKDSIRLVKQHCTFLGVCTL